MNRRRIAEEGNPVKSGVTTVLFAILTGIGIAIGFHIVQSRKKE
ncbi:unnamed protein product [marine sediment metagenome]|uniref:Uncharacterized protein n=1 Tax=marine sediment metagenome TaxID=412755 RepID=X1QZC7_9ZZZZ